MPKKSASASVSASTQKVNDTRARLDLVMQLCDTSEELSRKIGKNTQEIDRLLYKIPGMERRKKLGDTIDGLYKEELIGEFVIDGHPIVGGRGTTLAPSDRHLTDDEHLQGIFNQRNQICTQEDIIFHLKNEIAGTTRTEINGCKCRGIGPFCWYYKMTAPESA